jgi:O-antigen biosynthesis protein
MNLSIVIPIYNKFNFTKSCLDDLSHLDRATHEIIIVDNASTDGTYDKIKQFNFIKYIRNDENMGFAKAVNLGFQHSIGNSVMFLNNDIRVKQHQSDWTQPIISNCNNSIVGPTMGELDINFNFIRETNSKLIKRCYMVGWCIASSRNIWNKLILPDHIGPFSEEFGLAYFEDADLGGRCRKLNIDMTIVPVPLVHFGKQTSSQLNTYKLYCKAKDIFTQKWKNQNY